ncbi:Homoserine/homoserine lactone efflux protein [Roseovarius sp. THAF27]|uniref:LysE family translocator n=1 Tax=Roseovarius sp. THAF27 TaxID=2587850 RepID=UPI001267CCAF|nr:LysE family translocator [Roseovarius sp. THAF27]QFT79924.1 Homoserine/homoserine lactone efflux protein [Roseovarius sp. THAF27]
MPIETWTIYLLTVLALMSTPGPSQLLMLSNSGVHGFQRSLATAAGDLSANALQMLAAGLGLAAIIAASATALSVIKWAGVVYLIWLGIRMIRRAKPDDTSQQARREKSSLKALWIQGFITSAANPKAVVFFAALFPQFIAADAAFWSQFLILSATYIVMDGLFLSAYGLGSSWIVARFKGDARVWVERIGGGFMIGAAVLLGLKSISRQ